MSGLLEVPVVPVALARLSTLLPPERVRRATDGRPTDGSAKGSSPTTATPSSASPVSATPRVATSMPTSGTGPVGHSREPASSSARVARHTARVGTCTAAGCWSSHHVCASTVPSGTSAPLPRAVCERTMSPAMPAM